MEENQTEKRRTITHRSEETPKWYERRMVVVMVVL